MKAGELSELWTCSNCESHDGEWLDCLTHTEWECFVLRCLDCGGEWYDHEQEMENN